MLKKMLEEQSKFHDLVGPSLKIVMNDREKMIADTMRNIIVESVETMNEVNWKPWKKTKKDVNWQAVKEELSDIWIFLMNGILESGMTAEEFNNIVINKINKNFERQENGY